jgi:hypothetical protein
MQLDYRKNPIRIAKIYGGFRVTLSFSAVSNGTNLTSCETDEWCRTFNPSEVAHTIAVMLDISDDDISDATWEHPATLKFELTTTNHYTKISSDLKNADLEDIVYQATDNTFWCVNE